MRWELPPKLVDAVAAEWRHLAAPGATLSGAERLAVAATVRAAQAGDDRPTDPRDRAAAIIAAAPATITEAWVDEVAAEIGYPMYVEVVGIVARLAAVDAVHRGLGLDLPPLPNPEPGDASGAIDPAARKRSAWVPMAGAASITHALSLVPAEMAAQEELHGPLYLTYRGMDDLRHIGGLARSQMELVAARTSAINECFY